MPYTKQCKSCTTTFIDTSNNQRRICDTCKILNRLFTEKKAREKIKDKAQQNTKGKIQCLVCLKYYIKPLAHAWQVHNLSEKEYKETFQLERKGLIPLHHKELLQEHNKAHYDKVVAQNLLNKGKKTRYTAHHKHNYIRKPVTLQRLKQHIKNISCKTSNHTK